MCVGKKHTDLNTISLVWIIQARKIDYLANYDQVSSGQRDGEIRHTQF